MEKAILLWLSKKYGNLELFQHPSHTHNILYFKNNELIINVNQYNNHVGIDMDIFNYLSNFFELSYFGTYDILRKWLSNNYYKEVNMVMPLTYRKYWVNEYNSIKNKSLPI